MKKAIQMKNDQLPEKQLIIQHEKKDSTRLNKYISNSGFCSRKEADRYIEKGMVTIDNILAKLGDHVFEHQEIRVNNQLIKPNDNLCYLILNKPRGITCTNDLHVNDNIIHFMNHPESLFPVGRLDKDSSGLIILTNDGDIVNKILRSTNGHEKEYIVTVDKNINKDFLTKMSQGVKIYNPVKNIYQTTNMATVTKINDRAFRIIITQGLNRQIRRMCKAVNYRVCTLERIRIMNIKLGSLPTGQWRYLQLDELSILNELIKESTSIYIDPNDISDE